jgi:hypothetical protein
VYLPAGPMEGSKSIASGADIRVDGSIGADGHAEAG